VKTCIVVLRVMSLEGTVVFEKQTACIGGGGGGFITAIFASCIVVKYTPKSMSEVLSICIG
jgi:hypothetical protein